MRQSAAADLTGRRGTRPWLGENEEQQISTSRPRSVSRLEPGHHVLDVGCGAGVSLRVAADLRSIVPRSTPQRRSSTSRETHARGRHQAGDMQHCRTTTTRSTSSPASTRSSSRPTWSPPWRGRPRCKAGRFDRDPGPQSPEECDLTAMKHALAPFRASPALPADLQPGRPPGPRDGGRAAPLRRFRPPVGLEYPDEAASPAACSPPRLQ